jgi:16S rRNA (adenine1518-N6/adenine1519-N6)-dimethyltransferase
MTLYEEVREALRDSNFRPRKRLGQNFLVHERVIDAILRLLDLNESDEILEIGPGLGFLTRRLVALAGKVYAVEVDEFLFERLRQGTLALSPRLQLLHGDILEIALDEFLPRKKIKLAANLPYSISTPVFFVCSRRASISRRWSSWYRRKWRTESPAGPGANLMELCRSFVRFTGGFSTKCR